MREIKNIQKNVNGADWPCSNTCLLRRSRLEYYPYFRLGNVQITFQVNLLEPRLARTIFFLRIHEFFFVQSDAKWRVSYAGERDFLEKLHQDWKVITAAKCWFIRSLPSKLKFKDISLHVGHHVWYMDVCASTQLKDVRQELFNRV